MLFKLPISQKLPIRYLEDHQVDIKLPTRYYGYSFANILAIWLYNCVYDIQLVYWLLKYHCGIQTTYIMYKYY